MIKTTYDVYVRRHVVCENPEDDVVYPWQYIGMTKAVSAAQAINNVRFRKMGNISQYLPVHESSRFEVLMDWKAVSEDGTVTEI